MYFTTRCIKHTLLLGAILANFALFGQTWNYSDYITAQTNNQGEMIVAKTPLEYVKGITDGQHTISVNIPENYYSNCLNLSGNQLREKLHSIISTDAVKLSYTPDVWTVCKSADQSPTDANSVWLIYSEENRDKSLQSKGNNGSNDWNREHVWAKSHGDFGTTPGPGTDAHHLRAADSEENSRRSYLNFSNVNGARTLNGSFYEPPLSSKGDVARMILYMAVRWEGQENFPDLEPIKGPGSGNKAPDHGDLTALLQWHEEDPVDPYEIRRNNIVYQHQKNRNPFVDHPELVHLIFGSDQNLSWDGGAVVNSDLPSIKIDAKIEDFGVVQFGNTSSVQSYTISAEKLEADLKIEAPVHFEIATSKNGTYFKSLILTPINGLLEPRTIYVRFKPESTVNAVITENLRHTTGNISRLITVAGKEGDPDKEPSILYKEDFETDCAPEWEKISFSSNKNWGCTTHEERYGKDGSIAMAINNFKADEPSNDWLISPKLDIALFKTVSLNYWINTVYSGSKLELKYSFNYTGNGKPEEAEWFSLKNMLESDNGIDTKIDITDIKGNNCHFAFVHTTDGADASHIVNLDNFFIETTPAEEKANQKIFFAPLDNINIDDTKQIELHAYSSSGLSIEYEIITGPATILGSTVQFTEESGTVTIQASQKGNQNFEAAEAVQQSFEATKTLSIDDQKAQPYSVYPNPSKDLLFINGQKGTEVTIQIIDLSGKEILVQKVFPDKAIDVSQIKRGFYILKIYNGTKAINCPISLQ